MGLFGSKKAEAEQQGGTTITVTLEDGQTVDVAQVVNCLGDSCPRPQLMTKKVLGKVAPGEVVEVKIDNPTSLEAVVAMIPDLGGIHLGTIKGKRGWSVFIRRT